MGWFSASVDDHLVLPASIRLTSDEHRLYTIVGRSIPAPQEVNLLIDTGSRCTSLTPKVLRQFGALLTPRSIRVETMLAVGTASLYYVRLEFPDAQLETISEVRVASLPLPRSLHHLDGVIGRDILRRWERMVYFGRRGKLTVQDQPSWLTRWLRV